MIELPDDGLDKLFRKSSEELDPQYEPDDWNALKKRLDGHDGRTVGGWLRKWWAAGLLALLIPAGILMYYFNQTPDKKHVTIQQAGAKPENHSSVNPSPTEYSKKPDEAAGRAGKGDIVKTEKAAAEHAIGEKTATSEKAPAIALERKVKILPRGQSEAGGVSLEPDRSKAGGGDGALIFSKESLEGSSRKPGFRGEERRKGGREERRKGGMEESGRVDVGLVDGEDVDGLAAERVQVGAEMLRARPFVWNVHVAGVEIKPVAGQVRDSSAGERERVDGVSPKWAVRVGYSPDLTTVGFKNLTRVGAAFSILGEYGVTRKLYLQTGLVRSVKDYSAGAGEYKFYKYVTSINTPYEVDGVCTMYEIPLGIRYDLTQKRQSRWFVGSGFTSYYVQKEKYTYHYKRYVHDQKPGWEGKTGLFLFSHLNASVGYERSITRKLSILAEPYIRVPLKGVGYGKVNLLTTGAWISLRYTPVFK